MGSVPLSSLNPAARKKRIALLAKNPGTRSSIPDKYLPTQYRAARANAQRVKQENATLYNPSQILSGKDLRNAVKSEVDLQLNPQIAAFDRSIGSLKSQRDVSSARLGQYYDLYNKATAGSAAALSSSGQQLANQLASLGKETQSTLSGIQSGITARNAADTALRGAGLQDVSGAQGAVDFNKAQAAGSTQDTINQAAAQASGTNSLASTIAAVAPMRAADAQTILASKFNSQIADMMGKRADAEASRGDLTTTTLNKMRQDQFTNLATAKGLDIKQADLNETIRKNQATEKLTSKAIDQRNLASVRTAETASEKLKATNAYNKAQIDIKRGIDPVTHKKLPGGGKGQSGADALNRWKLKFAQSHGYLPSTGKGKGGKGSGSDSSNSLTLNERNTQAGKFAPIFNTITRTVAPDFKGDRKSGGSAAAAAFLKDNPNADPLFTSIALDMAYDGHISRANTRKLKARGLNVADLQGVKSFTDWQRESRKTRRGPAGKVPGFGNAGPR